MIDRSKLWSESAVHVDLARVAEDYDLISGLDHVVAPINRLMDQILEHVVINVLPCAPHDASIRSALSGEELIDPCRCHVQS